MRGAATEMDRELVELIRQAVSSELKGMEERFDRRLTAVESGLASVRQEMKEGLASVRQEMKEGLASVRGELKEELTSTRVVMFDGFYNLNQGLIGTHRQIITITRQFVELKLYCQNSINRFDQRLRKLEDGESPNGKK